MRAVVDTNILVRAIIMPHGTVGPVLLRLRRSEYTLLYAQPLLEELIDVLNRPRIRLKYSLTEDDIARNDVGGISGISEGISTTVDYGFGYSCRINDDSAVG